MLFTSNEQNMSWSWSTLLQKGILALGLVAIVVLLCVLARRRLGAYEEQSRARRNLLFEIIANVSDSLDQLEAGLDDIAARAAAAKSQVNQFTSGKRQNLFACALLRSRNAKAAAAAAAAAFKAKSELAVAARVADKKTLRGQVTRAIS